MDTQKREKDAYAEKRKEELERIRNFRLMDDEFMTKVFEGNPECIELVLRIVLEKDDLKVLDVRTQVFVENLLHRSVRLDVLATDSKGIRYNVEIQRTDRGAGRKRARYNSSMMDMNLLEKSKDFGALPETYVIFITEGDVIGKGKAVYPVERYIKLTDEDGNETYEPFDDGNHIRYVNGSYRNDDSIGKLMHDFGCTNPDDMHYKVLAERSRFFKEAEGGVAIMSKIVEEWMAEERAEERIETMASDVKKLMEKLQMTAEQAMSILEVSDADKALIMKNM